MRRLLPTFRLPQAYWPCAGAAAIALTAWVLQLTGQRFWAHWLLSVGALSLLIAPLGAIWRNLQSGHYDSLALPVLTVAVAVSLRQYWVAIAAGGLVVISDAVLASAYRREHRRLQQGAPDFPERAEILRGRKTVETHVDRLSLGDKLIIRAGMIVPVDVSVMDGAVEYDAQLLVAGASHSRAAAGMLVPSGARILQQDAFLRVEQSAQHSTYQQSLRFRRHLAVPETPSVKIAERFALVYSIAVVILAVVTAVVARHMHDTLQVLAASTVVPLLFALPLSLMRGTWVMAQRGLFVRSGQVLERLSDALSVVFDTSVLQAAAPKLTTASAYSPFSRERLLELVAGFAAQSDASYLPSVVQAAKGTTAKVRHVATVSGGLQARFRGKEVLTGGAELMDAHDIKLPKLQRTAKASLTVYVAYEGRLAGYLQFQESFLPELKKLSTNLKKSGVRTVASLSTTALPASTLSTIGFDTSLVGGTEGAKLRVLESLASRPVAYVTGGDSLAHHSTEIGIILGADGTAMATGSASVFSLEDSPQLVLPAIRLAERSFSRSRQSIVIGMCLSLLLVLLAVIFHVSPYIGLAGQLIITLFVVWNSRRRLAL